jgi:hypothetical protein
MDRVFPAGRTVEQSALLLVLLAQSRDDELQSPMTRLRLSEPTLKQVCGVARLHAEFVLALQDALLTLGWCLFFADRSYAMIRMQAVENWGRLGSKRIGDALNAAAAGTFDYDKVLEDARRRLEGTASEDD